MIVMGAGTNHWFHSDKTYRAILPCHLTGCQGVNGGGWAHYVGQEKCRPITGWTTCLRAGLGASAAPDAGTAFWYLATDQWRYDRLRRRRVRLPAGQRASSPGRTPPT